MTIYEIEKLTEAQANEMKLETLVIKGHQIYLIDLGGAFGYSALVFKNGKHIHYANEYELHHQGKARDDLRKWYINALNHKLFTEDEIREEIKNYDEFQAKRNYLTNYYNMQTDYVSAFCICNNEKEEKAFKRKIKGLHYNPVSFCYMSDKDFITHQMELMAWLMCRKAELNDNYEYYKNAFVKEMFNHEYAINLQADYDTLGAFGSVVWKGDGATLDDYFDQLNFNEIQRKAYVDARKEYYKKANEADMF